MNRKKRIYEIKRVLDAASKYADILDNDDITYSKEAYKLRGEIHRLEEYLLKDVKKETKGVPKMVSTDGKPIISAKSMLSDEKFRTNIGHHLKNVLSKNTDDKFEKITEEVLRENAKLHDEVQAKLNEHRKALKKSVASMIVR